MPSPSGPLPFLRRALRGGLALLLLPVLLFEEWGWEPLAALVARLARLPLWAALERWVRGLPPWAALLAFGAPVVVLLPVKLLALYLFGRGQVGAGCVLLVGAKILGTAVVARLFQLTLPALMRIPLFARWYPRWKAWKDRAMALVRGSRAWRGMRGLHCGMRRTGRGWRHRWRRWLASGAQDS